MNVTENFEKIGKGISEDFKIPKEIVDEIIKKLPESYKKEFSILMNSTEEMQLIEEDLIPLMIRYNQLLRNIATFFKKEYEESPNPRDFKGFGKIFAGIIIKKYGISKEFIEKFALYGKEISNFSKK